MNRSMGAVSTIVLVAFGAWMVPGGVARAEAPHGFLETVHRHVTLTSTVPENGDQILMPSWWRRYRRGRSRRMMC